jgi:hypothetical protein
MGINLNLGCTWEPKEHFVGADAEENLKEYIHSKEVEAEKAEKRRGDILAGKLVVTGKHAEEIAFGEPLSAFLMFLLRRLRVPAVGLVKMLQVFGAISMAGLVTRRSSIGTAPRHMLHSDQYATFATCMFLLQARLICVLTCNPHRRLWSLKS